MPDGRYVVLAAYENDLLVRKTASVTYDGPALETGMYYQFRVISIDNAGDYLSTTEDLKGVFFK